MDDDVTTIGEGVVLETAAASVGLRAAGAMLDAVVLVAVYIGSFIGLTFLTPDSLDLAAMSALVLVHLVAVFVGIPVALETATRGRSVGKYATGVRIVRDDGGPIGFRQALVRGLVGVLDLWLTAGGLALITAFVARRGKRLGDILAGTYALKERAAKSPHRPLEMPPELAGWASTADVRRLPDGLALAARQFLSRVPQLNPVSRQTWGVEFADQLAPYVSPAAPAGTHPEHLIEAALTLRRDREHARAVERERADAAVSAQVQRLPHGIPEVS
ncbi:RDD family protein [Demequina capsici]|uniref:RDD family protein n=1 Tax=Demequina capsici TaxID=3075620 RepID=A0AA96JA94_9MICO|nr:RDD family protein [Demequina sp. PMTSA13]WNM26713.1 RDD family protein [Demequina sp. PMTSA13]